jgi:hypothetical protein
MSGLARNRLALPLRWAGCHEFAVAICTGSAASVIPSAAQALKGWLLAKANGRTFAAERRLSA